MKDQHYTQPESQEESSYSTGQTQPTKSRRSKLAVLLVAVILLCGVVTVLGLMNIRVFHRVAAQNAEKIVFRFTGETLPDLGGETAATEAQEDSQPVRLQISETPEPVDNVPQEGGLSLQEIYDRTANSVVSVICNLENGTATGCGVIISEKGYLVTNAYILRGAAALSVTLADGRQIPAKIVGTDAISDLAVLHVEADGLQAAQFGDDSSLRVGDAVVAIGDPLGIQLRGTMTEGIVSAINRDVDVTGRTMTLIQATAAQNAGNAGGPLINCHGQVVGIHTEKFRSNTAVETEDVHIAIPSTTVKEVVDQLLKDGRVTGRPRLGVTVEQVSVFDQLYYRYPAGLFVTQVAPGTDAVAKGLVPGDILLSMDGKRLTKVETLQKMLQNYQAGDTVLLVVYRQGQQHSVKLTLWEAESP